MSDQKILDNLPVSFDEEESIDEFMSRPSETLINELGKLKGNIMILGVGGKMGPTLARLAKRAAPDKKIFGVARFTDTGLQEKLEYWGIDTFKADLLDSEALGKLPNPENIIFMVGRKFGSTGSEENTWAANVLCPALVAERFRKQRIVIFSTACVYPFVPVESGGAKEERSLEPPGEYAQSCVGRERMFQYFSKKYHTPGCIIRLSYAIDLRYGVLFDVADAIFRGREIDVSMGYANVIWQGDANAQILRALGHCAVPTWPLNLSGSEATSIRWLAEEFGKRFGKTPELTGTEAKTAWLINTEKALNIFGEAQIPINTMIDWVAEWVIRGGKSLGKPTHFEARDGAY